MGVREKAEPTTITTNAKLYTFTTYFLTFVLYTVRTFLLNQVPFGAVKEDNVRLSIFFK